MTHAELRRSSLVADLVIFPTNKSWRRENQNPGLRIFFLVFNFGERLQYRKKKKTCRHKERLPRRTASLRLAAAEQHACGIVVGVRSCRLLPAFTIKACQINALLDSSADASCQAARDSQSIWPPVSSISNTPPQAPTHTRNYPLFPECFSSRSASYYSPAFCLSVAESLSPISPTCSYILCVPLQPCGKRRGGWGVHFNWILGIYNGDY